jgi:hypothetical protein
MAMRSGTEIVHDEEDRRLENMGYQHGRWSFFETLAICVVIDLWQTSNGPLGWSG